MSVESDDDFFDDDSAEPEKDKDESENEGNDDKRSDSESSEDKNNSDLRYSHKSDESDDDKKSDESSCGKEEDEKEETGKTDSERDEVEEEIYEEEFDLESEESGKNDDDQESRGEDQSDRSSSDRENTSDLELKEQESRSDDHGGEVSNEQAENDDKYVDEESQHFPDVGEERDYEAEKRSYDLSSNPNEASEELENFFNTSHSNFSSSNSSSPSKSARRRPKSAKSQMKVLITANRQFEESPCSSEDSRRAVVFGKLDNNSSLGLNTGRHYNLRPSVGRQPVFPGGQTSSPPPLLVAKSPVHTRPLSARRPRDNSPRSCITNAFRPMSAGATDISKMMIDDSASQRSQEGSLPPEGNEAITTQGPALSSSNRGINRVLSSKEQSSPGHRMGPKPRPKSAVVTQPKIMARGQMATSTKIVQPRHRPLGDYTRSLQMLGVKVPSPAPKAPRTPRSSSSQSWQSEGKLHTRVTRRSTSLEDVTRAIPQVKDPQTIRDLQVGIDEAQRATLSQAIYEEWYFRRCKQIRSRKIKTKQKVHEEQRQRDSILREKEDKVGVAIVAWEEKKTEERKLKKDKKREIEAKKDDEVKEKDDQQMRVTSAVIAWETEKIELLKKKREKKKQEKEVIREKEREKFEKREEAELAFLSWKEQKKHTLRDKRRAQKEEEEERRIKEEEDLREKREIADLAFTAWKKKKMYEDGLNLRKTVVSSELSATTEARKRMHRSSEALEAYGKWLDDIDEKELVRSYSDNRVTLLQTNRPPWWPGGTRKSLMGSC